jgi:hypothetical protein
MLMLDSQVKVKLFLALIKHITLRRMGEVEVKIRGLFSGHYKCGRVVSFTPLPLYPPWEEQPGTRRVSSSGI